MLKLSVVIITLNEEPNIGKCLGSVREIAGEIVVVDSGSTDKTVEICKSFGCTVIFHEFKGYSEQKQFALEQATGDWILSLDADEWITPELRDEIHDLLGRDHQQYDGYFIPFTIIYLGRPMKHSGLGREEHLRSFRRDKGHFPQMSVHEGVSVEGNTGHLKGKMIHQSYRDLHDHIQKLNTYTSHAAEGYVNKGKHYGNWWVAIKFPITFITVYVLKGGFLDGYPGFMWSFLAAVYGSLKIAKTIEMIEK